MTLCTSCICVFTLWFSCILSHFTWPSPKYHSSGSERCSTSSYRHRLVYKIKTWSHSYSPCSFAETEKVLPQPTLFFYFVNRCCTISPTLKKYTTTAVHCHEFFYGSSVKKYRSLVLFRCQWCVQKFVSLLLMARAHQDDILYACMLYVSLSYCN